MNIICKFSIIIWKTGTYKVDNDGIIRVFLNLMSPEWVVCHSAISPGSRTELRSTFELFICERSIIIRKFPSRLKHSSAWKNTTHPNEKLRDTTFKAHHIENVHSRGFFTIASQPWRFETKLERLMYWVIVCSICDVMANVVLVSHEWYTHE